MKQLFEPSLLDDVKKFLPLDSQQNDETDNKSLKDTCTDVIIQNFDQIPVTKNFPPELVKTLLSRLTINKFNIKDCADYVHSEDFWKELCMQKFGGACCNIEDHGLIWKQLYFERSFYCHSEEDDPNTSLIELVSIRPQMGINKLYVKTEKEFCRLLFILSPLFFGLGECIARLYFHTENEENEEHFPSRQNMFLTSKLDRLGYPVWVI